MPDPNPALRDIVVHPFYDVAIADVLSKWKVFTFVDILMVVDDEISTDPANDFGIALVIDLIRNTKIGCMRFRVDIALRSGGAQTVNASPSPTQPKYTGFRFDMVDGGAAVIDKYEQIWCFGFKPNSSGLADDGLIDQAFAIPASNAELNKLDEWMNTRKGGVFGTGDHHFLGASMCRKIPRLGTMRRWTVADGVPPQGRSNRPNPQDRIDTLRPPSAAFLPGAVPLQALDNDLHQGDLVVQPIRWVADASHWASLFFRHKRPHPVLCHPTLGPIDVMPDHAHEGLCVPNPNLAANKKFKAEREYPDAIDGGAQPSPKIIAYGSNLGQPPYLFTKGVQPARNDNPMIAVYDGHRAGVGRVATDSTWHHWMDVNIDVIRLADTTDWKKIKRYFQNLAVWLNPPGFSTRCFYHSVVASHFQAVGFQEYWRGATVKELGVALRSHLHFHFGPCWVTERIFDMILDFKLVEVARLPQLIERRPDFGLDGAEFEALVLGRMVEASFDVAEAIKETSGGVQRPRPSALSEPEKLFAKPVATALREFVAQTEQRCGEDTKALRSILR